jgi:hypothetical protein
MQMMEKAIIYTACILGSAHLVGTSLTCLNQRMGPLNACAYLGSFAVFAFFVAKTLEST